MSDLVQLAIPKQGEQARRPPWLKVKVTHSNTFDEVGQLLDGLNLNTVCREARCPNIWECWGQHKTATFMILGEVCTRACRYCSVTHGRPQAVMPDEPQKVAQAVQRLGLTHTVVTSVDRDDLEDFGSGHFVNTIAAIRALTPQCRIEVLIPDFGGEPSALERVLAAQPDILDHNIETVPRLYPRMRSRGDYQRALGVLKQAHQFRTQHHIAMTTKTGVMVGLGEEIQEIFEVMDELRDIHCDVLTVGQYLNPTKKNAPIARFYSPEEFALIKSEGIKRGFKHVESGPLVRSSYHAHEHMPQENL